MVSYRLGWFHNNFHKNLSSALHYDVATLWALHGVLSLIKIAINFTWHPKNQWPHCMGVWSWPQQYWYDTIASSCNVSKFWQVMWLNRLGQVQYHLPCSQAVESHSELCLLTFRMEKLLAAPLSFHKYDGLRATWRCLSMYKDLNLVPGWMMLKYKG